MAASSGLELSGPYIVFLTALELKQELAGVLLVACGFLFLARRVLVSVDWTLLLVFMAMFIDVHLLIQLPVLQNVLHSVSSLSQPGLWLTAIGLSQFISNVPRPSYCSTMCPLTRCWPGRLTSAEVLPLVRLPI
jgi:di/tricarboxylate transporter